MLEERPIDPSLTLRVNSVILLIFIVLIIIILPLLLMIIMLQKCRLSSPISLGEAMLDSHSSKMRFYPWMIMMMMTSLIIL